MKLIEIGEDRDLFRVGNKWYMFVEGFLWRGDKLPYYCVSTQSIEYLDAETTIDDHGWIKGIIIENND